jgi:poly(A) polymerase Pap1
MQQLSSAEYALNPLSLAGPNALDLRQSEHLRKYLEEQNLYEGEDEAENREHVLGLTDLIVKDWVKAVHVAEGYSQTLCEEVNAKIFTFGSYRLGVHGPGADIDTLVVGPRAARRDKHFFGAEPYCLEQILRVSKHAGRREEKGRARSACGMHALMHAPASNIGRMAALPPYCRTPLA